MKRFGLLVVCLAVVAAHAADKPGVRADGSVTSPSVTVPYSDFASPQARAFFPKMLANGFSFSRLQAKNVAAERGTSAADTLARFAAVETSVKHPPGPVDSWLGEWAAAAPPPLGR